MHHLIKPLPCVSGGGGKLDQSSKQSVFCDWPRGISDASGRRS
jgi:hypothetical protein